MAPNCQTVPLILIVANHIKLGSNIIIVTGCKNMILIWCAKSQKTSFKVSLQLYYTEQSWNIEYSKMIAPDLNDTMIPEEKKNLYDCDICDASFSSNSRFKRHFLEVHDGKKPFVCKKCNKRFA